MKRSGYSDMPLHKGQVPYWLAQRMQKLGGAITEAIVLEYGRSEVLKRLSDPFWFQALGCVMGMDWHSSGITTSVMGALKKAINPKAHELGIYFCGGRGKHARQTPSELLKVADQTGVKGHELVKNSKLAAKVDNTAFQDGFQLYLHSFIVTKDGAWAVVQQGMNNHNGMARRYHWHSEQLHSFIEAPHTSVCGKNQGSILNLTAQEAGKTRQGILELSKEKPAQLVPEMKKLLLPNHHDVYRKDINLKRLGAVLATAQEIDVQNFQELIMVKGLGPRTLQSLTLVSEVIHGTPSRFSDPARFSFAHGGKDKKPFPVPTRVYDQTLETLRKAVDNAKIGHTDKQKALKNLYHASKKAEKQFQINPKGFEDLKNHEQQDSWKHGGRSVFGKEKPPQSGKQLRLF